MIRPGIRRLFRLSIWRRDLTYQDLGEEILLHLELRAEQFEAEGMSAEAARAEARRRFHAADPTHMALRRAARRRDDHLRAQEWVFDLLRDVRYAVRTLSRSPGYSAVIVLTLALGIGTSVAIHAVVRGLVTDAMPFPDPDRLVSVDVTRDGRPGGSPREEDFRIWESEAKRAVVASPLEVAPSATARGHSTPAGRASPTVSSRGCRFARTWGGRSSRTTSDRRAVRWSCSGTGSGRDRSVPTRASSVSRSSWMAVPTR